MAKSAEELIDTFLEDKSGTTPEAKESAAPADELIDGYLKEKGIGLRPRQRTLTAAEKQETLKGYEAKEEATRDIGLGEAALKGVAAGTIGIAADVGTVTKYLGHKFESPSMIHIGETAEDYWENVKKEYEAPESLQGDIVMPDGSINTELLTKGSWWAYHVAQMVPSLAASVIPAVATARGVTMAGAALKTVQAVDKAGKAYKASAITLAGKQILLKPATIQKLARVGGALAGGAAGGALEGSGTYREVIERGGTPEEAASAAEQMFLASGALNALSLDFVLKKLPASAKGRILKRFLNGATEGITEYLEGPAEAKILLEGAKGASYEFTPEEFGDKIRQEANVIGPAFLLGMFMPVGALTGTPKKKKDDKKPDDKKPIEPERATGVTVTDEEGEVIELSEADEALKQEFDILSGTSEPTEDIVMEATPEEQMDTAIEEVDMDWGNAFDPGEYNNNWSENDRDTFDLLYEAADFNPAVVDETARMAEIGVPTEDINAFLIQTIQEGYNARIQEAQSQQEGQAGSAPLSGEQGAGLQPVGAPETTGGPAAGPAPAGGPEAVIDEGIPEPTGDRPAEPIAEPAPEEITDGETPVDELQALADEDIEAQLADAELEAQIEEAETTAEEPAIEEMDEADIEALLMDDIRMEGDEVAETAEEPAAEAPETTGGPSAKPSTKSGYTRKTVYNGMDENGEATSVEIAETDGGKKEVWLLDENGKRKGIINSFDAKVSDELAMEGIFDEDVKPTSKDRDLDFKEPETTGGPSAKGETKPEKPVEPKVEEPQQEAVTEEEVGPEPTEPAAERDVTEDDYAYLSDKEVVISFEDDTGAVDTKTMKADKVIKDIDNRLNALEAFRKCMKS